MTYAQKLKKLREIMAAQELAGFLVPRTDEYQGEYVAENAERLAWLTGFTGSAGMAIILNDQAMVMSDGRYTIQLENQVDGDLYAFENSQEIKPYDWLAQAAVEGAIGYDPKLHTPAQIEEFEKAGVVLLPVAENLIDKIWQNRPAAPKGIVHLFPEKYAGRSATEKILDIQAALQAEKCGAVILSLSDSIAWLLNIRGSDIPFIPVALSYAIVPVKGKVRWFIDSDKITDEVRSALADEVEFIEEDIAPALKELKGKIWLDTKRSSVWFKNQLSDILEKDDPCIAPRARKNATEQAAMKNAHIRDGVAFAKFLKWFEGRGEGQTEISIEQKLESFRAQSPEFKEPSFSTISGYAANGAIVHYRADAKSNKTIKPEGLLLLDSGAQYEDGTTDITRTLPCGVVSEEMREHYTLVLKGHIALASAVFEKGTLGKELDALARAPLQEKGLDYAHGTGHGVGCYLSVHEEAAMGISPRSEKPLEAGMIISNEPGYYKQGDYGIRIENLVLVSEVDAENLCFDTLTLVPIDTSLVALEMLNAVEKDWLNTYHAKVFKTIAPLVETNIQNWLKQKTVGI